MGCTGEALCFSCHYWTAAPPTTHRILLTHGRMSLYPLSLAPWNRNQRVLSEGDEGIAMPHSLGNWRRERRTKAFRAPEEIPSIQASPAPTWPLKLPTTHSTLPPASTRTCLSVVSGFQAFSACSETWPKAGCGCGTRLLEARGLLGRATQVWDAALATRFADRDGAEIERLACPLCGQCIREFETEEEVVVVALLEMCHE